MEIRKGSKTLQASEMEEEIRKGSKKVSVVIGKGSQVEVWGEEC
jgi:hypothetical protein